MHEEQPGEASLYLRGLAERIAQIYAAHPQTRAIILTGSAAEGVSDCYSDIDLIVYYDALPTEDELLAACQQNHGEERTPLGPYSEEGFAETYRVAGVECQVAHTTIAGWEREMAAVLEELDVTSPIQKALSGLLEAIPLYGEPLIRHWQAKLASYPDALAEAMVKHYLTFFPLWAIQQRLAPRDATIWLYEILTETTYHLLGTLAGLNRRYFSTFQFKRTGSFIAQLPLAPTNLAPRLEALFHTDIATASRQARELIEETVDLVEQYMSQIDTSRAHKQLNWRERPWKPV